MDTCDRPYEKTEDAGLDLDELVAHQKVKRDAIHSYRGGILKEEKTRVERIGFNFKLPQTLINSLGLIFIFDASSTYNIAKNY